VQVEGLGIHSISRIFKDFGYREMDELAFPGPPYACCVSSLEA
jgi:hypothetical protein